MIEAIYLTILVGWIVYLERLYNRASNPNTNEDN